MSESLRNIGKEVAALSLGALAILLLLGLATYHAEDPTLLTSAGGGRQVQNLVGMVGANIAALLLVAIGVSAYWLPLFLFAAAVGILRHRWSRPPFLAAFGLLLLVVATSGLAAMFRPHLHLWGQPLPGSGGILGMVLTSSLLYYLTRVGACVLLLVLLLIALLLTTPISLAQAAAAAAGALGRLQQLYRVRRQRRMRRRPSRPKQPKEPPTLVQPATEIPPAPKPLQESFTFMRALGEFRLPDISLLDKIDEEERPADQESLLMNSRILEKKLADFGVDGKVTEVCPGPVITMYEFEPAPGIKISKIMGLADDLAMALKAPSIRVVAPIPGKGTIGIEIPNGFRRPVVIRDIIASQEFSQQQGKLILALGKDTTGRPVVANLAKMPHLLIAGATGTGKSVCLNAIIVSLLYRATPEEVRLLLIDPKRIELSAYEGIPHLLHPVVTDAKKANTALRWAVAEMERRYELLTQRGVRSIDRYNQMLARAAKSRQPAPKDPAAAPGEPEQPLPYLVLIIDELADLMMVASREVEECITRLAQMARAAGIHLVLATQRPSVDVLTGIIKANIPARISFQVSSRVDSRTILDAIGAESLLGAGDMLMLPPGTAKLQRIHGAFVSEPEIKRITDFLRSQRKPDYDETILHHQDSTSSDDGTDEVDEKYDEAVRLVLETRQASISMLQRRLRVGYNRAARMIEMMEREGLVSAADGSKPREVLSPE